MASHPTAKPGPTTQSAHAKSVFRNTLRGEDAYARHTRYVRDYVQVYAPGSSSGVEQQRERERKTDFDVLKEAHRFIRDDTEDLSRLPYADQLAVKYYSSLFKEFVICDLKHYKSGAIALRWRTDEEVISGAGQFTCANPRCAHHAPPEGSQRCAPKLTAYELPFAYEEDGESKTALVKAVLCGRCAGKLVWRRERERERRAREGLGELEQQQQQQQQQQQDGAVRRPYEGEAEEEEDDAYDFLPARPPDLPDRRPARSRSPARHPDPKKRYERRHRSLS